MNILLLSEHFAPRVAGTAVTVRETAQALVELGHDVTLIAPSSIAPHDDDIYPFLVRRVGPPLHFSPQRSDRYAFCRTANKEVQRSVAAGEADLVHVLFGPFLMEVVETGTCAQSGIPTIATVHNVPPRECARAWESDTLLNRLEDAMRLRVVALKNNWRLRAHRYDAYVTPSEDVAIALRGLLDSAEIVVVPHGVSPSFMSLMNPPATRVPTAGQQVRLLTVAGWAPHKRLHLIPQVAARMRDAGIDFRWDIVGPWARNTRYFGHFLADTKRRNLDEHLRPQDAVAPTELAALYDRAHIYVQPSTEEGFCLTALDAAAAGLPVIGSPAGAIPEMVAASGGAASPSDVGALAATIIGYIKNSRWPDDSIARGKSVRQRFNWRATAEQLVGFYLDTRQLHTPLKTRATKKVMN